MIVECRPDSVAANSSQQLSGGSVVCDPLAIEVETMNADGPIIVSPIVPSSSAPGAEGDLPRPAGDGPSVPVLKDVGCQTLMASCSSMATQTSVVHLLRSITAAETQTPASPVYRDVCTYLQCDLACCVRYSTERYGADRMMVSVCREDLLNALLTAVFSRSGCSVVGRQLVRRDSVSQPWPAKHFGHQFVHKLDAYDVQLALPF